jgi:pimeloyl-ACP methyl ester carboxylesterase
VRFILVHGGFHAGWCWQRTIAELNLMGHDAVAVDLPGHGARIDDALEEWTIPRRRDAILEVVQPGDVLVGHSGGGFDATVAADAAVDDAGGMTFADFQGAWRSNGWGRRSSAPSMTPRCRCPDSGPPNWPNCWSLPPPPSRSGRCNRASREALRKSG